MAQQLTGGNQPELVRADPWPQQVWFVRRSLLTVVLSAAAAAALLVEFILSLAAGAAPLAFTGLVISTVGFAVMFRQRWVGLAVVTAGTVVSALFAVEVTGSWTVTVFALFVFAMRGKGALAAGIVVAGILYLSLAVREGDFTAQAAVVAATACLGAAAAGSAVRLQEDSWMAARRRLAEAAAARTAELERAVSEERLRIARDLHDGVGHEIAAVNVSVGVAEVALPPGAEEARRALHAARDSLQRILVETQRILELLRSVDTPDVEFTELARAEHIPALIDRMRATGATVVAELDPVVPELGPDTSAAAYRIVQEALTNARRYGEGDIHVLMATRERMLVLEVRNRRRPRTGSTSTRKGFGMVGMRERAESAGGMLAFAETADEFRLHVELPTMEDGR